MIQDLIQLIAFSSFGLYVYSFFLLSLSLSYILLISYFYVPLDGLVHSFHLLFYELLLPLCFIVLSSFPLPVYAAPSQAMESRIGQDKVSRRVVLLLGVADAGGVI